MGASVGGAVIYSTQYFCGGVEIPPGVGRSPSLSDQDQRRPAGLRPRPRTIAAGGHRPQIVADPNPTAFGLPPSLLVPFPFCPFTSGPLSHRYFTRSCAAIRRFRRSKKQERQTTDGRGTSLFFVILSESAEIGVICGFPNSIRFGALPHVSLESVSRGQDVAPWPYRGTQRKERRQAVGWRAVPQRPTTDYSLLHLSLFTFDLLLLLRYSSGDELPG
jgi:hypothetical protein